MALPPGFLDDIRARVPLSRIVGRRVTWDQRKTNGAKGDYWAPCPFHQEKSASFHVDDGKGYYYCFGCQAKGDAITFLRETGNLDFMEAVEALAREAGVALPERDPATARRAAAEKDLGEAMEAAVQFYRLQLNAARAVEARAYLERRGLRPEAIAAFEIGYAPDSRTALLEHLTAKGFPREKLVTAGLVGMPESGGTPYDRFRGRIMFPIRDPRGRAIAFGARAIAPGQEPKYLNSPETPLFDKGRNLFNAGPARAAAGKAGTVVVAEGYMDVIALAAAGIPHAVAPLGTAITEEQLHLLWRISAEPVVALDGDRAGLSAARRLIDLALPLLEPGRALRFALLPAGQDPDDVIRAGGAAAMTAVLAASVPMVELLWRRETEGQVLDSPERKRALDQRLRDQVDRIRDPGLRAHYEAEIRERRTALFAPAPRPAAAGTRAQGPRAGGGSARGRGQPGRPPLPVAPAAVTLASALAQDSPGSPAEARVRESAILHGCLTHPAAAARLEDRLARMSFVCEDLGRIRDVLLSALATDTGRLREGMAARLGRDPLALLGIEGRTAADPRLRPGADTERAAAALEEALRLHDGLTGLSACVSESAREILSDPAEHIDWRLREAAETAHRATARAVEQDGAVSEDSAWFETQMKRVLTEQAAGKTRRR